MIRIRIRICQHHTYHNGTNDAHDVYESYSTKRGPEWWLRQVAKLSSALCDLDLRPLTLDRFMPLDHLCQLASTAVHSFSQVW